MGEIKCAGFRYYEYIAHANGVCDQRAVAHSLRAGGATPQYKWGAPPIDAIQRRRLRRSLIPRQYTQRVSTALRNPSDVFATPNGLLLRLEMMRSNSGIVAHQEIPAAMGGNGKDLNCDGQDVNTTLFLANERFRDEIGASPKTEEPTYTASHPSGIPAFTAHTCVAEEIWKGTIPLPVREKHGME